MTTDDQYTPTEEQVRAWCREGTGDYPDVMDEWLDRFLARVRRDAAREALDGLAAAEHRATRAEAQAAIRGRAVVIYRERAREADAERDRLHSMWRQRGVKQLAAEHRATPPEAERDRWHSMWRQRGVKHLAAEKRATRAEAERDEWRQTALDERAAALDALEQIKARDARIKAVRELHVYENRPVEKWARGHRFTGEHCAHDGEQWPCRTIRALEG